MSAGTDVRSGEGTGAGTSALLLQAVRGDGERVTVGQILDALDARAFGLATLVFSLPSIVPMPPGVPTVVGIALLIVSLQMVIGRHELWLPGFLSKRSFARMALVRAFEKLAPRLESVEKIAKPRLLFMTGKVGTVLIGLVVLFMALVLILPLPPGGN
ncbi:MAG TPA: exopolysaccharide biosynthesis protein, partial [Hyphomonadaceae bacterium]|nr:exopolysaccharide biosynthesis protein [Hyphomonadaceae bacterium]